MIIPSVSVSSSQGIPGSLNLTKARLLPSESASVIMGAVVLIALLAAVDQDAVLRHLGHERLLRVWTATARLPIDREGQSTVQPSTGASVLLGGFPSRRRVLQDGVETAVGRHLSYPLAETRTKERQGDFLEKAMNISASRIVGLSASTWSLTPSSPPRRDRNNSRRSDSRRFRPTAL